ncbi:MAG: helix-turn-helix domain-containing protein [Bacteriovoracia bacterium]
MYTNNKNMPKVRRDAVLFADKYGIRCAARHYGFSPSAISKWRKKAMKIGIHPIPTKSSRPKSHPNE